MDCLAQKTFAGAAAGSASRRGSQWYLDAVFLFALMPGFFL
jgi:hypothetical protein